MTRNHFGADLSKDLPDVFDPRRGERRIVNRAPGIRAWLAGLDSTDCLKRFDVTLRQSASGNAFEPKARGSVSRFNEKSKCSRA